METTLDFRRQSIERMKHIPFIEHPSHIVSLDLSHNLLKKLDPLFFTPFTSLREIHLGHNRFSSYQTIVNGLKNIPTLRILTLERSLKHLPYTEMFQTMRFLERIDDVHNPHLIKEQQWSSLDESNQYNAIQYLYQTYHISPNNLSDIRINAQMTKGDFWACLLALSTLCTRNFGIQHLYIKHRPILPEYRFICIHFLPSLQTLDGVHFSVEERENATYIMQHVQETKEKMIQVQGQGQPAKSYETGMTLDMKKIQLAERLTSSLTPGGQVENIDFFYVQKNAESIPLLETFIKSLHIQQEVILQSGSLLTSVEVLIHFLQILSIVLEIPNITIPIEWRPYMQWITYLQFQFPFPIFHLPKEYVSYTIMMMIPPVCLIIYHVRFRYESWVKAYVREWKVTAMRYTLFFICSFFVSIVCGYGLERINHEVSFLIGTSIQVPALRVFYYAIGVQCFFTLILLGCLVNMIYFRAHQDVQTWHTVYHRYRKKFALFILTIFYMPIARILLQTFVCQADTQTLMFFPFLSCPSINQVETYPVIFWVNMILCPLYVIGIPMFFARLIYRKTKQIEYGFDIETMEAKAKELKDYMQTCKKNGDMNTYQDSKGRHRELVKKLNDTYMDAVQQYRSASAYLYASFRRTSKYYKIYQCMEKVFLLICTTCLPLSVLSNQVRFYILCSYFSCGLFYHIGFQHPFYTWISNLTLITTYVTHIYNTLICMPISNDTLFHYVFLILNYVQCACLVFHMIYIPIQHLCAVRKHAFRMHQIFLGRQNMM
jgi:hypothetical protein